MNRRDLLRRGFTLGAGAATAAVLPRAAVADAQPVPAYLQPVDPALVFCIACRPDLFPQPRAERVCARHYGIQFHDYRATVTVNGKSGLWITECIAGEDGVAWAEPEGRTDWMCPCGASEQAVSILRGRVEVRGPEW